MLVLYIFSRVQHTVILVHMPRANKKPNLSACSQNTLQLQTSWVSSINAKLRCQSSYLMYVVSHHWTTHARVVCCELWYQMVSNGSGIL